MQQKGKGQDSGTWRADFMSASVSHRKELGKVPVKPEPDFSPTSVPDASQTWLFSETCGWHLDTLVPHGDCTVTEGMLNWYRQQGEAQVLGDGREPSRESIYRWSEWVVPGSCIPHSCLEAVPPFPRHSPSALPLSTYTTLRVSRAWHGPKTCGSLKPTSLMG